MKNITKGCKEMTCIKRLVIWFLVLVLSISLAACGSQKAETPTPDAAKTGETNNEVAKKEEPKVSGGTKRLGFTAMTFNNPFFIKVRDAVKKVAEENGYTLIEIDGQFDPAKQAAGVENLITQKVDGIVMNPVDGKAIGPTVRKANEAQIPVVAVDVNVDEGEVISYVASDNVQAGEIIGEYLVKRLDGKGEICVIDYPLVSAGRERIEGLMNVLDKYPDIKILAQQKGGDTTVGMKLADTWLQQFKKIDAIFGINDPNALGALTAIETAKREKETFVVGVDGAQEAIDAMKGGRNFGATAAQQPDLMGKVAAENLIKFINGETVEKVIKIPVYLSTKENAK